MRKILLVSSLLFIVFLFSACSAQKEDADTEKHQVTETTTVSAKESTPSQDSSSYDSIDITTNVKMQSVSGYDFYQTGVATIFTNHKSMIYYSRSLLPVEKMENGQWSLSDFVTYIPSTISYEITCSKDTVDLQLIGNATFNGIGMQEISGTITDYSDFAHAVKGYIFESNGYACIVFAAEQQESPVLSEQTIADLDLFMQEMAVAG